jgi:hypothetical protein
MRGKCVSSLLSTIPRPRLARLAGGPGCYKCIFYFSTILHPRLARLAGGPDAEGGFFSILRPFCIRAAGWQVGLITRKCVSFYTFRHSITMVIVMAGGPGCEEMRLFYTHILHPSGWPGWQVWGPGCESFLFQARQGQAGGGLDARKMRVFLILLTFCIRVAGQAGRWT